MSVIKKKLYIRGMELKLNIPIDESEFNRQSDVMKLVIISKYANEQLDLIDSASQLTLYGNDGSSIGCGAFNMRLIGHEPLNIKTIKCCNNDRNGKSKTEIDFV